MNMHVRKPSVVNFHFMKCHMLHSGVILFVWAMLSNSKEYDLISVTVFFFLCVCVCVCVCVDESGCCKL